MDELKRDENRSEELEADAQRDEVYEKSKLAIRMAAEQAGLVHAGVNDDGEDEYIGTIEAFETFKELNQ